MLVVGTESKKVLILDENGNDVKKEIVVPSIPVQILCEGQFTVDYRLFVSCRDGRVYTIRSGRVVEPTYTLESKPIGLVRLEKTLVIACMDSTLHSFYIKGKKNFSLPLPS